MTEPERRRRRPAVSCTLCRRRKIRCNRESPCNNCLRSKNEFCTYESFASPGSSQRARTGPGVGATPLRPAEPRGPLEPPSPVSLDDSSASCKSSTIQALPSRSLKDLTTLNPILPPQADKGPEIAQLKHRIDQLEQSLSLTKRTRSRHSFGSADINTSRSVMHKSRLFGRSHWVNGVVMWFRDIFEMIEPLGLSEGSKAFITMRKCKSLARVIKARRVPAWPTAPTPDLPPKELADALVERYLSTMETVFRVLHVPTFKRDYAAVWAPDAKPDPAFLVQLKLVLAIGAASHDRVFSLRVPAVRWVYEGHTWLSTPEFKRRLTVQSLQTNILLILAREFVGIDEGSLWISFGSLFRAATYMGLHRDPVYLPKRSLFASEMRRRLWNTILELAVWTSLSSGGSPFLSLDDFDTRAPGNYDDDQLTLEDATPQPADHFTQSSVAIALRETFPARLAVLKFLNELSSAGEYDEALRLDAKLRAAYKTMGHSLRAQNTDQGSSETPRFALRVADILMNRYFASLHAASGPAGDEAVPYDMDDSLTRLTMCASGPFRIAATYSSLMIAAELKLQRREDDSVSSAPPRPDLLAVVKTL
ncbi:unnamed protein product [Parascedosporium putredinis]|uniref:Zn(2)-C6 fungal-type domain-containing protein n=1 Tax=Parascedosporium putredinis TaxID=1442378 RepID=A0A9P1MFE4_9PEZI|nr:unnamed protein product [Parascedosporium putredinis]CAI8004885.1 unnamed protein product [Parascedosporium putredinis]